MKNLWGREPALILAAINTLILLACAFGLRLSSEQIAAIMTASTAILAVWTRQQVTPNGSVYDPRHDKN